MYIKDLKECEEIVAGDNTILKELLNPLVEDIGIGYSIAHARVKPGEITLVHKLTSSEVYYILEGKGEMYIDSDMELVCAGQAVYVPPNAKQKLRNTGNSELVFLCLVDPPWKPEVEEVLE